MGGSKIGIIYFRLERNLWVVIVIHATVDIVAAALIYLNTW